MDNNDKKMAWVNYAKGIGIILVVLGHSISGVGENRIGYVWKMMYTALSLIHMPLFFCISGFLYALTGSKYTYLNNIRRKSLSLGVPYLIFNMVYAIIGQFIHDDKYNLVNLKSILWQPISHFWFLYVLFAIFIIYPIVIKIVKYDVIIVIFSCGLLGFFELPDCFEIYRIVFFSIFFGLGIMIYKFNLKLKMESIYILGGMVVVFVVLFLGGNNVSNYFTLWKIIMGVAGISICLFFANRISEALKLIALLGKDSMPIYIYHSLIVSITRSVFYTIGIANDNIVIISSFLMGVFLSYYVYLFGKRFKLFDFAVYPLKYLNV